MDSTIEPNVIVRLYSLAVKTHKAVANFPKHEKYCLGKNLETALADCIASACLAAEEQKGFKTKPLLFAVSRAELAKLLLRMAHELQLITISQYQQIGSELVEITAMLGGWLRHSRTQ